MPALANSLFPIVNVLGAAVAVFAATMLAPLGVAFVYDEAVLIAYDKAFLITFVAGATLWLATRRFRRELLPRDGFLLVTLIWTVLPAFATLPLGGMGILVLMVAILPLLGVGGTQLFRAETAGPIKDAKLTPRITDTAIGLWGVYGAISAACFLAYWAGGMSVLDAAMHMFTTMSLGGLSPYDASFGHFASPRLEWISVFFMAVASVNFALYFVCVRKRSLGALLADTEARGTLAVLAGAVLAVAVYLYWQGVYDEPMLALRHAAFNVVSIATTTGYATVDFNQWPTFAPWFMLLLSGVATSAGSTGAGIKMIRFIVLVKQARREMLRALHPAAISPVRIRDAVVENNVIFAVLAFMLMYGTTIIVMTFLLVISGLDIITAFSAIVACVNNMGPGLNQVGPAANYGALTDFETWICSVAMLLGRLEMMSVFVLFTPAFWRK